MRLSRPTPRVVVLHSPTPSRVRIAASSNGLGKNALAERLLVALDDGDALVRQVLERFLLHLEAVGAGVGGRLLGCVEMEKEALKNLADKGVTIVECDKDAFRKRVLPQTDNFIKARPEAKPVVDMIRATQA